jgi:hypothetical protein
MASAAFATVALIPIVVSLRFITSRKGTRVSNRIAFEVFFMSHLLEVLYLMITISILPFPCINTMWQWQQAMIHSNTAPPEHAAFAFFIQRREDSDRYKKHNKERILYTNNESE